MTPVQLCKSLYRQIAAPSSHAAILLFHRINEVDQNAFGPDPQLSVSPAVFEDIVSRLASGFRPVALPELISQLKDDGSYPSHSVVLTFDDGFRDTLTMALPILETYEVPATVYVTTGFVEGSVLPYEYVLAHHIEHHRTLCLHWEDEQYSWILDSREAQERCYREVKAIGKPLSPARREQLLECLDPAPETTKLNGQYMTPEETAELAQHPLVTVGAHTHSHPMLSALDSDTARSDIQRGHKRLEEITGGPVSHFSYPYGAYGVSVQNVIREMGFSSGVTTQSAMVTPASFDLMSLPRIEVQGTNILHEMTQQL